MSESEGMGLGDDIHGFDRLTHEVASGIEKVE